MSIKFAVLAFPLLLLCSGVLACSCLWRGNFEEYAKTEHAVVKVRIIEYGPRLTHGDTLYASMRVKILKTLRGQVDSPIVTLMGDPGHLCREYIDSRHHIVGKEYLIILHSGESEQAFGGCGEAWLSLDGDTATGTRPGSGAAFESYTISLKELTRRIAAQ